MRVPLGKGDYERAFARAAALKFVNRMYEVSPQNQTDQVALISRPGSTLESFIGPGPIRATFTQEGLFGGDLFVVSGPSLYRYSRSGTAAGVATAVDGAELFQGPSVSFAGTKGAGFELLFLTDTDKLYALGATSAPPLPGPPPPPPPDAPTYTSTLSDAKNSVNITLRSVASGLKDKISMDGVYYIVVTDTETLNLGNGSLSNPYRVYGGAPVTGSAAIGRYTLLKSTVFANLTAAVNNSGTPGTHYTNTISAVNARVIAEHVTPGSGSKLVASNRIAGVPNPSITTRLSVVAPGTYEFWQWTSDTLVASAPTDPTSPPPPPPAGFDPATLYEIPTPDDRKFVAVATLASFVLLVQLASQRVYFTRPGNTAIDALDFFEAESTTDDLVDVVVTGDQVWLMGKKSIEPWFLTAALDPIASPFEPAKGQAVSIGAIPGTVVNHDGFVYFAGSDHNVYELAGGLSKVSNPGISERIRRALRAQE